MSRLFGRQWRLTVGTLDLTDLDLSFKVTRSVRREPNRAEIQIYNLSETTRSQVENGGEISLFAGYEDPPQLFRGDSRYVWTVWDGFDAITTVTARDGGRAYADVQIARSYNPGTLVATVVRDIVDAMGIGRGNLEDFSLTLRDQSTLADGYVAHGRASRVLNDLIRSSGHRWSVQNGSLQIQRQGQALQTRSVVLSADSGLIGVPTWDERGNRTRGRRGLLSAVSLIQPGIEPGRQVRVEAGDIEGDFEVRAIEYVGSTFGQEWDAKLTLRRPTPPRAPTRPFEAL